MNCHGVERSVSPSESSDSPVSSPGIARAASPQVAACDKRHRLFDPPPKMRREIFLTGIGIAVTLGATAMVGRELIQVLVELLAEGRWGAASGHVLFMVIVAFLVYGGLVYQLTRLNYLRRRRAHAAAPREELEALFDGDAPELAILVPSYREEPEVVLQTLMSAALQDYPNRRVVLLIDDPPRPGSHAEAAQLEAARALPQRLRELLAAPARRFRGARADYLARRAAAPIDPVRELHTLARLYDEAAGWFTARIREFDPGNHATRLFLDQVLEAQRTQLLTRAAELRSIARDPCHASLDGRVAREYNRLAALFAVDVASFERKRYENLSHEPNKAMNLNSYIGLLGKSFRERRADGRLYLDAADPAEADVQVPDAEFLITLDADSVIRPDYALRLVHVALQPGNERVAVAQTPYSAFPEAPGVLERVAGATTDIQYIIHQGFTSYRGTYWVGANALLRKSALLDIAEVQEERGFPVTVFIQDRTVIEDTESTVDLIDRGWELYNYPERLAFSATPPDFGALIIQRRRWANGGLIILPKLLRYLARGPLSVAKLGEALVRIHYLVSIAAVNFGLLIVLAVPFDESLRSWWLPLTALPYFGLYGRDLCSMGYRASDLFRVYALNLLLIPVNLGGVLKSLQQAWTKKKIPFGRTPKVDGRTAAAPLYIVAEYALLVHWTVGAGVDVAHELWLHAAFALGNAGILLYAILVYVGIRESREDLAAALRERRRPRRDPATALPSWTARPSGWVATPGAGTVAVSTSEPAAWWRPKAGSGRPESAAGEPETVGGELGDGRRWRTGGRGERS